MFAKIPKLVANYECILLALRTKPVNPNNILEGVISEFKSTHLYSTDEFIHQIWRRNDRLNYDTGMYEVPETKVRLHYIDLVIDHKY